MKTVAGNRRAMFDYEITEKIEAGIILSGPEVKSCREGHVQLAGAYVSLRSGTAVIKGMKISHYKYAGPLPDYDPAHDRILLLKKSDIERLSSAEQEKGVAIVPLEVRAGRYIKVVIGLGKGRKRMDKRSRIKERDIDRRLKQGKEY